MLAGMAVAQVLAQKVGPRKESARGNGGPSAQASATLGSCPVCGGQVAADSRALPLPGAFFHIRCALVSSACS